MTLRHGRGTQHGAHAAAGQGPATDGPNEAMSYMEAHLLLGHGLLQTHPACSCRASRSCAGTTLVRAVGQEEAASALTALAALARKGAGFLGLRPACKPACPAEL